MIRSTFFLLFSFFIFGCNRVPTSDFATDRSDYAAGDVVTVVSNSSENVATYSWTVYEEKTGSKVFSNQGKDLNYKISIFSSDGQYSITLVTRSKKDKKTAHSTKNINVQTQLGALLISGPADSTAFWADIDGEFIGNSSDNVIFLAVPIGPRTITATDGHRTWTKTLNILAFPAGNDMHLD